MISYHQSCEWNVPHAIVALEPTVMVAVIGSSSFVAGVLSDRFGRKRVMGGKLEKSKVACDSIHNSCVLEDMKWLSLIFVVHVVPKV
jgi:hypothetical protein